MKQLERQEQQAVSDRREKKIRDKKYARIYQSVQHELATVSRGAPAVAKNLKDKMHTVKSMEKRFLREDEAMTQMPEQEEAIFFKLGDKSSQMPAGKTVLEYKLPELNTPNGARILAKNIFLRVRGAQKICIVGKNGAGKTTLLKKIAEELLERKDIRAAYMPQNYEELLQPELTPVAFLAPSGSHAEKTMVRTYLGSLKYMADEMEHPIRELSGGQKAKVLLLKMSLSGANVLILDEPTRNFSPLSGPVIRKMIKNFPGTVISISHDRKYIGEVCNTVYELTETGLVEVVTVHSQV
jgi:ATPase subunit of ABC transporter with duplicated ATPase domains